MLLRILAVIAFVIAIILFIIGATASAGPDLKDIAFGLAATAAGLALLALTPFDHTNVA